MTSSSDDFGFRSFTNIKKNSDEFDFVPFHAEPSEDMPDEPKESMMANIGRQAGRTGARVAETVLGAPRALGEFGEMLIPEKRLKNLAGKVGLRKPVEKGLEFVKEHAPYKLFPKSEQVRDVTKTLFKGKTEPKNKWEGRADELVSDFTALALPLPGSKFKALKPALLALGGNIASTTVGELGGSKKDETYAKLGTILAGSFINPKSAEKLKNSLYEQARNAKPSDAKVSARSLEKSMSNFEKQLFKGDPSTGSKKKSLSLIKEIKDKIQNNEINIDELEEFKRNINEARSGLFDEFKVDKVGRKSAKRNLDHVSKLVDDTLNEYGKTNPEWEAFYRPANEVHGAIAQSQRARKFIEKNIKKYGKYTVLPALGIGHLAGGPGLGAMAAGGGIGASALFAGEMASKIMKSPTLRKHYFNLIQGALKEDAVVVKSNLDKLQNELE